MRTVLIGIIAHLLACSGSIGSNLGGDARSGDDARFGDVSAGDSVRRADGLVPGDLAAPSGDDRPGSDSRQGDSAVPRVTFTVVTFNTGTSRGLAHDSDGDAYGDDQARSSEDYYGNGLAWQAAVDNARDFLVALQPDMIAFQEIFYSPDCASVPTTDRTGFVCETWQTGQPTVAQVLLGAGYQVACHLGKTDKCLGVRMAFGSVRGCSDDLCLDGLDGVRIDNCGGGSRIGRGTVDLVAGGVLNVVTVHGTSGFSLDDMGCRVKQVDQIFVDFDGQPAANGDVNLIMGDLNTDPYRAAIDSSAGRWRNFVGDGKNFYFVSDAGSDAAPTYGGLLNVDHVISDTLTGSCWVPGITAGEPTVHDSIYFDHAPIVCDVSMP